MDFKDSSKPVRMPKARICHVCGRQYGLASFEIHLKQCKKLWVDRENQKPRHERKPLPPTPRASGGGGGGSSEQAVGGGNTSGADMSQAELDAMNAAAQDAYNNEALSTCLYCGRSFLPEKLLIHNKSCTAEKPAKRVGQARLSSTTPTPAPAPARSRPMSRTASPAPARSGTPGRPKSANRTRPKTSHAGGTANNDGFAGTQTLAGGGGGGPSLGDAMRNSSTPVQGQFGGKPARDLRKQAGEDAVAATLQQFDGRLSKLEDTTNAIMMEMGEIKQMMMQLMNQQR
mmetsp:Transcript_14523/g.21374  ORF Transcript_14523/g.21374 Transcript_14523/m.21374 type:complete len:287 (-) Transcript_14523:262-1122(-)|eukprot:CAMPEP_0113944420 /NCGR_PEP_ID=MMETSP1339-20121228/34410_1 /TAXON_ID=94617 /ORGANISM="Fibrocapsa japonica" /LENGTH=286 /DNA_ID=CAMNT_0000949625 /DNA_START=96 /DNA_END=956 /DNA_ORIENTATION=- /assembly_acc=CAM_ASM_000762